MRDIFTDYEFKENIGKGSFSQIVKGVNKITKKEVAIKIINKNESKEGDNKDNYKHFKTEIDIINLVQHENIISLYDLYENSDNYYIILEYFKNGALDEFLINFKEGFLPEKLASIICLQIANGLFYLKHFNIIHGDLKLSNVLINLSDYDVNDSYDNLNVKIIDFGLSKFIRSSDKINSELSGTIYYLAPETLLDRYYDFPVDVWSFGVLLYTIITGEMPFEGKNDIEVRKNIVKGHIDFDNENLEDISKEAKSLLIKLLTYDYKNRI